MTKLFAYRVRIFAGSWIDITADVRSVSITRRSTGATGERARLESGRCQILLDNRSGNYSPRNPLGIWYGLLGRNTPIEVDAGRVGGALVDRFYGEVPSWPPRWSLSGVDRTVDVDASGTISRADQGTQPDWSPMRRTIEATLPVAYWPVEDGALAEGAGSAGSGQGALVLDGVVDFKTIPDYQPFVAGRVNRYGTTALADLSAGGRLSATLDDAGTAATLGGPWTVAIAGRTVAATLSATVVLLEWTTTAGTYTRFQLQITTLSRTQVIGYTASGAATTLIDFGSASSGFAQHAVSASRSGTTVTIGLWRISSNNTPSATATFSGTLGGVTTLKVNPTGTTSTGDMPFGHAVVWAAGAPQMDFTSRGDSWTPPFNVNEAGRSWWGEDAADRLERVAAESGVNVAVLNGSDAYPTRMGFQQPSSLVPLVESCIDADGGMLYESRTSPDWVYRRRTSLYGQTPLTISYVGQTTAPLDPDDNTSKVRNDVTVRRLDGSSARVIKDTGPLTPALVPVPPDEVELNLLEDAQTPDQAGWRVHLGTIDELRYPAITVELASPEWQATPALLDQLLALDVGGVLAVDQLPTWLAAQLGGRAPKILVTEYTETITEEVWSISFAGPAASAWGVATAGGEQRAPGDGSALASALGTDSPSLPLNSNPYFEANVGSWTGSGGTVARSTVQRHEGVASLLLTPDGVSAVAEARNALIPAVVGSPYWARAWVRCAVARSVAIDIDWYTAGTAFIATSSTSVAVPANTWTEITTAFTAPATAAQARIVVGMSGTPAGSHLLYIDQATIGMAVNMALSSTPENGVWTEDPADCPLDVRVGGEQVTASAIGPAATDSFTRSAAGWGTATSGQVWTTSGGSAGDYTTDTARGVMSQGTVGVLRTALLDVGGPDQTWEIDTTLVPTPTGAASTYWALGRVVDLNNHYLARLDVAPGGGTQLLLYKRGGGTLTLIAGPLALSPNIGGTWRIGLSVYGTAGLAQLRAKAYRFGTEQDPGWILSGTDNGALASATTATQIGVAARLESGNTTTLPVLARWDNLLVTVPQVVSLSARGVNGIQRAWPTGTEVDVWTPAIAGL